MRRFCFLLVLALVCSAPLSVRAQSPQLSPQLLSLLATHRYNLSGDGHAFLLAEAQQNDYFLLGELHGDNEIPQLLHTLWPQLWANGYRHIAAEVSPWTAVQLAAAPAKDQPYLEGTWTRRQAREMNAQAAPGTNLVWGCDMEELHPEFLLHELLPRNAGSPPLLQMEQLLHAGYSRKLAPQLLSLLDSAAPLNDRAVQDISLAASLRASLEIETLRAAPDTRLRAQVQRESLMKQQLVAHLDAAHAQGADGKLLLRFGRNHLHRGYDARGISTLGNFVAEYALEHHQHAFNVGAFGAGGSARLLGKTFSADERADEPAFALLARGAPFPATVYDLRPLRPVLLAIPAARRTPLETNLLYWADSYDALICFQTVTPLADSEYR